MYLIFYKGKFIEKVDVIDIGFKCLYKNGTYIFNTHVGQWTRVSKKYWNQPSLVHFDHIPKQMKMTALLLS